MTELACTPGQTVGPFFGLGLPYSGGSELVGAAYPGAVRLHGTVYDGAGDGVPDALVELWQPDGAGRIPRAVGSLRRDGVTFTGFGRSATDPDGRYAFTTVAPGVASSAAREPEPRFFAITVFARGLLNHLFTRAYLPDVDVSADPLLATLDAARRASLLCVAESGSGRAGYRFDIHLQGPNETVFLAYRDDRR
jgi:protocatechuate 3,4-dioxygenase, alpha subunit